MPTKPLPKAQLAKMKRRFRLLVDVAFEGNLSAAGRELRMPVSTVHQYYHQGPRRIGASVAAQIQRVTRAPPEWLLGETPDDDLPPEVISWAAYVDGQLSYPPLVSWRVRPLVREIKDRVPVEDSERLWEVFIRPVMAAVDAGLLSPELAPQAGYPPARDYEKVAEENRTLYRPRARVMHTLCAYWERALSDSKAIQSTKAGGARVPHAG